MDSVTVLLSGCSQHPHSQLIRSAPSSASGRHLTIGLYLGIFWRSRSCRGSPEARMRVGKFALGLRAQSTCPEACRWAASAEVGTVLASVVGGGRVNAGCSFSGISAHLLLSYVQRVLGPTFFTTAHIQ